MAAVLGRTEIQVKKTSTATTVPNDPIAKLMYYFNCICTCVEADDDYNIRRLRDYKNYLNLSSQEEAQLLVLCLALSPDKLIGTIFLQADDSVFSEFSNEFLELSEVKTRMVITESLLVGGQQKKIHKVMMFKKSWLENNYFNPLLAINRGERPPRQAALLPPKPVTPVYPPTSSQPVTRQPYTRPVTTSSGLGGQYTYKVQQSHNDADVGIGSLVFGLCTTFCLAVFGCWWALPCSIIAIVLGITSSGNSGYNSSARTQRNCSVFCSICSWVTVAAGIAAIVGAVYLLNANNYYYDK